MYIYIYTCTLKCNTHTYLHTYTRKCNKQGAGQTAQQLAPAALPEALFGPQHPHQAIQAPIIPAQSN